MTADPAARLLRNASVDIRGQEFVPMDVAMASHSEDAAPTDELLRTAHDHHAFGPEECTPANCSVEAYLSVHHVGYHGRVKR